MTTQHTWFPDHPHANHNQWLDRGWTGRLVVWTWAKCSHCGVRTAVVQGAAGDPCCDACLRRVMALFDEVSKS